MHEFSLIANLVSKMNEIAARNNAKKIVGVKVRLGALAHISEGHFREHFIEGVKGTSAEDATLEVVASEDEQDPGAQDILLESVELVEAT